MSDQLVYELFKILSEQLRSLSGYQRARGHQEASIALGNVSNCLVECMAIHLEKRVKDLGITSHEVSADQVFRIAEGLELYELDRIAHGWRLLAAYERARRKQSS